MAFKYQNQFGQEQQKDTSWGLIYRLNELFRQIETDVAGGNHVNWNLRLDRIFANICFKNPVEVTKDEKGNILDVQIKEDDIIIFQHFNRKIKTIQDKINFISTNDNLYDDQKKKEITKLKNDLYDLLYQKDLWMRKLLFHLKLYLQNEQAEPAKAIYR